VVEAALRYLSEDHEKPQLIVVGTYAPHFPYVAPEELYREYRTQVRLPAMFHETPDYMNPILQKRKNVVDEETVLAAQAAYLALITYTDQKVGQIREAFADFVKRRGSEHLFCYLSDHGDQVGERDIFGKCTFFEKSAKIPMMFAGDGIPAGKEYRGVTSIMDLGPTLCEWAGVEQLPVQDGRGLLGALRGDAGDGREMAAGACGDASDGRETADGACGDAGDDRVVASEMLEREDGRPRYGLMLRQGRWKYIVYSGYEDQDILFDLAADPEERCNVIGGEPAAAEFFRRYAQEHFDFDQIEKRQRERAQTAAWMAAWERAAGIDDSERWSGNTAKACPRIR